MRRIIWEKPQTSHTPALFLKSNVYLRFVSIAQSERKKENSNNPPPPKKMFFFKHTRTHLMLLILQSANGTPFIPADQRPLVHLGCYCERPAFVCFFFVSHFTAEKRIKGPFPSLYPLPLPRNLFTEKSLNGNETTTRTFQWKVFTFQVFSKKWHKLWITHLQIRKSF